MKKTIAYGDEAPGRLITNGNDAEWSGDLYWIAEHGKARTLWVGGKIAAIYDAAIEDDNLRIEELIPGDNVGELWRCEAESEDEGSPSYMYWRTVVTPDDVVMIEVDDPTYPTWPAGSLPHTLLQSSEVIEAVKDQEFASNLYGALCSVGWTHQTTGKEYLRSWLNAAELVCQLRGLGELPTDFLMYGNEGIVSPEIQKVLADLGWIPSLINESNEDRANKRLNLLEICEARRATEMPSWYTQWATGLRSGTDELARMHQAAFYGKVSFEEWCQFCELSYEEEAD